MTTTECGNMPYNLPLALNKQYMINANLDIEDGLVNGSTGFLKHVDFLRPGDCVFDEKVQTNRPVTTSSDDTNVLHFLRLEFEDNHRIVSLVRAKFKPLIVQRNDIKSSWTPIEKRKVTFSLSKNGFIRCRRKNFTVNLACAITVHKSQPLIESSSSTTEVFNNSWRYQG